VAIGFANLDHTSLDSTVNGKWLLYLVGIAPRQHTDTVRHRADRGRLAV